MKHREDIKSGQHIFPGVVAELAWHSIKIQEFKPKQLNKHTLFKLVKAGPQCLRTGV